MAAASLRGAPASDGACSEGPPSSLKADQHKREREKDAASEPSGSESSEGEELDEDALLARLAGHTASRRALTSSSEEDEETAHAEVTNEGPSGGPSGGPGDQSLPGDGSGVTAGSSGDEWGDEWVGRRKGKQKLGAKARNKGCEAPARGGPSKGAGGRQAAAGKPGKRGGEGTTCGVCGRAFASRTKLFAHIKAEGHAQAR